ncbi:MAG: AAA family ATPase [Actinomycetota bacterium]|nr:AAA family ATPase [Actinomycetota bacterium]
MDDRNGSDHNDKVSSFQSLVGPTVLGDRGDVAVARERHRRRRIRKLLAVLVVVLAWVVWRDLVHAPVLPTPHVGGTLARYLPALLLVGLLALLLGAQFVGGGASPHTLFRPGDIDIDLDDVVGIDNVKREVVKTLNLFLGHKRFKELGGMPRRGILFEGPPGTGKTYLAKAMAREADVPFLFVSATSFQSQFYGMTGRKIRSFFRSLRSYAMSEGGAIGYIDELDAIGASRSGMSGTRGEGLAGVVNTLLTEMQSFDQPSRTRRLVRRVLVEPLNRFLPPSVRIAPKAVAVPNVLVVAATNRADSLDPALLRPGRFDRSIHFSLPSRAARVQIARYYLARVACDPSMDLEEAADRVAGMTAGYSPVAISHIINTALPLALMRGRIGLTLQDLTEAKVEFETGEKDTATVYTDEELRRVAFHEAGHATVAYFLGEGRRLDVLSIVKRRESLGMLAHSDAEERFTRTKGEYEVLLRIAMGGKASEQLFFGEVSSGPAGDLVAATRIAAQMVGAFGFGKSLVSLAADDAAGPLSGGLLSNVLGDRQMRADTEKLLGEAYSDSEAVLRRHSGVVTALAEALVERRELIGSEIIEVVEGVVGTDKGKAEANRTLDLLLRMPGRPSAPTPSP